MSTSKGALKYGVYSKEYLMPWENESEFRQLCEESRQEWMPSGVTESTLVFELACLMWIKRRANRMAQAAQRRNFAGAQLGDLTKPATASEKEFKIAELFKHFVAESAVKNTTNDAGGQKIHSNSTRNDGDQKIAVEASVAEANPKASAAGGDPEASTAGGDPEASVAGADVPPFNVREYFESKYIPALNKLIVEASAAAKSKEDMAAVQKLVNNARFMSDMQQLTYDPASDPEILEESYKAVERAIVLGAKIDARIDKTITRLIVVKEYKRSSLPKLVEDSRSGTIEN